MGLNQQWVQHRDEDIITVKNPNITINVIHNGPRSCDCMLIFEALLGNNQKFPRINAKLGGDAKRKIMCYFSGIARDFC